MDEFQNYWNSYARPVIYTATALAAILSAAKGSYALAAFNVLATGYVIKNHISNRK